MLVLFRYAVTTRSEQTDSGPKNVNANLEQALLAKIKALSPEQVSEVEDFIEFLTVKTRRRAALDRLLAIAPALEAAGIPPITEAEVAAEVQAVRANRRGTGG
jgi:hypothetical protein